MRWLRLAAVLLISLSLTACWSRRELIEVSFVGMLGIDWADGQYLVCAGVITPKQPRGGPVGGGAGGGVGGGWTTSAQAPALDEAITRIDQGLSRSVTLAHVRAIIIGDAMARRGIGPLLDYLLRSVEVRPTAWIAVTPGRAAEFLQARPRQEGMLANTPAGYQDAALNRSSESPAWRLVEVAQLLQEEGVDLTLPMFRLGNRPSPAPAGALQPSPENSREIIYGGAGVFRHDRLVAWLSPDAARGYLLGIGRAVHGAIAAPCPEEPLRRAVFRLRSTRSEIRVVPGPAALHGEISVRINADLNELGCQTGGAGRGNGDALSAMLARKAEQDIEMALALSRRSGVDIIGLGRTLYRRQPEQFVQREPEWQQILDRMPVAVRVQAEVIRLGQLTEPYRWRQTGS